MFRKLSLLLVLFCASVLTADAQTVLENGKIPKDLTITIGLGSSAEYGTRYVLTIDSNGKVFYEDFSTNLPKGRSLSSLLNLKPSNDNQTNPKSVKKKPKVPKLKNRLSKKQIKKIIAAIKKSGFFEMADSYYGNPNLKEGSCTTHQESKSISISANGKTKSVGFYLGCTYGEFPTLNKFLALWDNLSGEVKGVKKEIIVRDNLGLSRFDNPVPKDLIITFETSGMGQHSKYVIKADGSVDYYPISVTTFKIDGIDVSNPSNKKKERLSDEQLKELISEFEKINFFSLSDRYATAEDGCTAFVSGGPGSTIISIQINARIKKVVFESGCISSISDKFRNLKHKIEAKAANVEANVFTENQN